MGSIKEINIKNRTYYFFDDMINIKNFDSNSLKGDKKLHKNIDIYYIGYITMEDFDYVNIHSVNPLYLIIGKVDRYIEKKKNYLILASTDKNKELLTNYTELWDVIKNLIEKINDKPGEYGKDFMKIKFNSDDNLALTKIQRLYNLTIIVKSVIQEDSKYYLQVFLDECLYEL